MSEKPPRGADLIIAERERQKQTEGFDEPHDNAHRKSELYRAAQIYRELAEGILPHDMALAAWPWEREWFKPFVPSSSFVRAIDSEKCFVKAGALVQAEIDRLIRYRNEIALRLDQINGHEDIPF